MAARTIAFGDIHGELEQLLTLMSRLPELGAEDTLVFLGDYIDRGADSRGVIDYLMSLPARTPARVVCLRGNHEDAWLRVRNAGWDEFVLPPCNGTLAALRSFTGRPASGVKEPASNAELELLTTGNFLPDAVVTWFAQLPYWYEDEHAIYVHAGLPAAGVGDDAGFLHPSKVADPLVLLWLRTERFFRSYRGKRVVVGHTLTEFLPQELSSHTPDDPKDLWAGENVVALDTGGGNGGFLTALELPALRVYESLDR